MASRILFAAGGTMGHIGPAISVAELISERNPEWRVDFVGTKSGLERNFASKFHWHYIAKAPLPRSFSFPSLAFPFKLLLAIAQSLPLVRGSQVVVGFGGYVATPIYIAAKLLRRPLLIHEANALPGFANRLGRKWARSVFVNFHTLGTAWSAETIGIPLRQEIVDLATRILDSSYSAKSNQSKSNRILVLGGSTGSTTINQVIWKSLQSLRGRYQIRHSVGKGNLQNAPREDESYRRAEFIGEMAAAYDEADLIIARAGAVTCAEIRELGKRSILIPLGHGNGEQRLNAQKLVESGNAISVPDQEFSAEWLLENLERAFALVPHMPTNPLLQAREIMAARIEATLREATRS